jgi:hypothetical protein
MLPYLIKNLQLDTFLHFLLLALREYGLTPGRAKELVRQSIHKLLREHLRPNMRLLNIPIKRVA